jgi:hypothetical protein
LVGRDQKVPFTFADPIHFQDDSHVSARGQTSASRYTHKEIDDVLNYLTQPELPLGAIPQISRDTGIPCQTLRD